MSALPQHDERVTCLSCRFSYPEVRGYCPMCGSPVPTPEEAALGPRPVAGKPRKGTRGLLVLVTQSVRRPLFAAAALLALAGGWFFLRARNAPAPDIIIPPAIAATPPRPDPTSTAASEKVAEPPTPASQDLAVAVRPAMPVAMTDDPAELWKRVRKGNTDAEVALAKMYLDGNELTQNCDQAHLLLLAAAKKRNRAAAQVLSNLYPQRCP